MEMRGNVALQHIHVSDMIDPPYNHSLITQKIGLDQLFGEFGTTTNYLLLSLHNIAEKLGSEHALSHLSINAFSECDMVSSLFYIDKRATWETGELMTHYDSCF